jgi:hypothetical protein
MKRRTFITAAPVLAAYAVIPKGVLGERVIKAERANMSTWCKAAKIGDGDHFYHKEKGFRFYVGGSVYLSQEECDRFIKNRKLDYENYISAASLDDLEKTLVEYFKSRRVSHV